MMRRLEAFLDIKLIYLRPRDNALTDIVIGGPAAEVEETLHGLQLPPALRLNWV